MFRVHPASTIAVLLALLMSSMPSTASEPLEPGEIRVCGIVENAVGWPVQDAEVRAFVMRTQQLLDNRDHVVPDGDERPLVATTAADGRFELILQQSTLYRFVILDPLGPTHPSRGGAIYQPATRELTTMPSLVRTAVCPGGADGIPMPPTSGPATDGRVRLASPFQGFIEARVLDGAAAGTPALGGVDVYLTPTLDDADLDPAATGQRPHSLHARTGPDGVARLACSSTSPFGPAETANVQLLFQRAHHLDARRTVPCNAGAPSYADLLLWRRPVTLSVRVSNETGQDDALTGGASPEADQQPPGAGVEGANVEVVATPAPLRGLAHGSPACGATDHVAVTTTNDTPYACEGVTGSGGLLELRLPWADAPYTLRASVGGYDAQDFPVSLPKSLAEPRQGGAGVASATVVLARPSQSVVGKVTDVRGAGIPGASVTLSNDFGDHAATTGADGAFSFSIPTGPYDVSIVKAGYNDRSCFVNVVPGSGAATFGDASPFHCWSLATTGKVVVGGRLLDEVTGLPIPGAEVCVTGTATCSDTRADGSVFLEAPPGQDVAVTLTPGQGWTFATTVSYPTAADKPLETADHFRGFEPLEVPAPRELTSTTLYFTDGVGPLSATLANLTGPAQGGDVFTESEVASDGTILQDLAWSRHPALPQFDLGDYVVTADRHKATLHYSLAASRNFAIVQGTPALNVSITMTQDGAVSTALTLIDGHTGQTITTGNLKAESNAAGSYTCGPVCLSPVGGSGLVLHVGHTYRLCGNVPGYLTTQMDACKNPVAPGQATTIRLNRTRVQVNVDVRDAHTNTLVEGLSVRVVPPAGSTFQCMPPGSAPGYCAGSATATAPAPVATGTTGRAIIQVPQHAPTELCFEVVAGPGRVLTTTPAVHGAYQENAAFQEARICPGVPASGSPTLVLKPLRAAGAAIAGKVDSAVGGSVSLARVVPTVERGARPSAAGVPAFACSPAAHDTPGSVGFPDCAGKAVDAATGAFSLTLPGGDLVSATHPTTGARLSGVGHLWNLTASMGGHYDAAVERVQHGANAGTMTLWPRAFTASVRVTSANGSCDAATAEATLTLLSLGSGEAALPAFGSTGAVANADGTCTLQVPLNEWHKSLQAHGRDRAPFVGGVFLVQASDQSGSGLNVALLSPRAASAAVTIFPVKVGDMQGTLWPHFITGSVTDANAVGKLNGNDAPALKAVAGAVLTAELQGGACPNGQRVFQGASGPDGAFAVPVACPGTYHLRAAHAAQLYVPSAPRAVVVGNAFDAIVSAPQDAASHVDTDAGTIPLSRTLHTLVVKTERLNTPTPSHRAGVSVDPEGIDVNANPAMQTSGSDPNAPLRFVDLPWGVYRLEVGAPSNHVPLLPAHPVAYVGPNAPTYTVYVRQA